MEEKVKILTPDEASTLHASIFDEYQAKFRELHKNLKGAIDNQESLNGTLTSKISEAEEIKQSSKKADNLSHSKLREAEIALENANNKMKDSEAKEAEANDLHKQNEDRENALETQRQALQNEKFEINEFQRRLKLEEKEILLLRQKVEEIIKNNKIEAQLK